MVNATFHYIPDPTKRLIVLGNHPTLDKRILHALQKPVQPLMTVITAADAELYLSQKYEREIVLNGEVHALPMYEHNGARFYRRSDLDSLVIPGKKIDLQEAEPLKEEKKIEKFHEPKRTETVSSPSEMLYFGLLNQGVLQERNLEHVSKVEEALGYMTEKQRMIIHLVYEENYIDVRAQTITGMDRYKYRKEKKEAIRIICEVIAGTYKEETAEIPAKERPKAGIRKTKPEKVQKEILPRFTLEQIAAAEEYLSSAQQKIVDLLYKEHKKPVDACIESKFSRPYYYQQKKIAERIIEAVAEGTYKEKPSKEEQKRGRKIREYAEEREKPELPEKYKLKPSKQKQDLKNRMEEYRKLHGEKGERDFTPEDDLDEEKYIGNLGKKEYEEEATSVVEGREQRLEDICREKHAEVKKMLRQKRRLPDLSTRKDVSELVATVIGDSTIDFLICSAAYPVAELYAERLYARATDKIQKSSWPLTSEEIYTPPKGSPSALNHFIATYEVYAQKEKTPEALVALYKENPALSRGYVAVVGRYLSGAINKPNWEYRPHWKIAWQELLSALEEAEKPRNGDEEKEEGKEEGKEEEKEESNIPLHFRATSFGELVKDPAIKAALRRGYAAMYHYSARARNSIIQQFLGFAKVQGNKLSYLSTSFEDAKQDANIGLFRALERFDYTRVKENGEPFSFMTYAKWWTRQTIQRVGNESKGIPVYTSELIQKYNKIREKLQKEMGEEPPEELVDAIFKDRTNKGDKTLKRLQEARRKANPVYLDAMIADDSKSTLHDVVADAEIIAPDDAIARKQTRENIEEALNRPELTEQEVVVITERYLSGTDKPVSFQEIGDSLDLSRGRIQQIEAEAIKKLRVYGKSLRELLDATTKHL